MVQRIYFWLVLVSLMACTKDYDLKLEQTAPRVVVEGRISSLEGPYFVRLTKSTNQLVLGDPMRFNFDSAEAVTNALVIISDNTGLRDTLQPVQQMTVPRYMYNYHDGRIDSVRTSFLSAQFTAERGYYMTRHIKGVPGRTYHLNIYAGTDSFYATAYMPMAPVLDSVQVKETVVMVNGRKGYLPFAYFSEPRQEKNFYLLQYDKILFYPYDVPNHYQGVKRPFPYYVTDDKILDHYVNGLPVRVILSGHTPYSVLDFLDISPRDAVHVRLSSLTKEAFDYYRMLNSQFEADGNVYKPVPASAVGNISGGALGLFYATDVSTKLYLP